MLKLFGVCYCCSVALAALEPLLINKAKGTGKSAKSTSDSHLENQSHSFLSATFLDTSLIYTVNVLPLIITSKNTNTCLTYSSTYLTSLSSVSFSFWLDSNLTAQKQSRSRFVAMNMPKTK